MLTKDGDRFFFDSNRTLFCAVIKENNKALKNGKRHLPLNNTNADNSIDMELSGEEFDKWIERSKGFEIMPEDGGHPEKRNFKQKLIDFFRLFTD